MFLPFPKTWIEMKIDYGRVGYLIEDVNGKWRVTTAWQAKNGKWRSEQYYFNNKQTRLLPVAGDDRIRKAVVYLNNSAQEWARNRHSSEWLRAILAIINTPRIIGRRRHMPHRELERNIVRSMKLVGKFPLHAWTEIKLTVAPPRDVSNRQSVEAHYTGMVAYHWWHTSAYVSAS